ncbi:cytochrome P450 [Rickenella mellea]|uniref:Cytochrome P450 n=1 Tax=Rickenella mellea TaxID=50990 RepID=A0A4Y7Q6D8_9AGAM|nr:cytochrome P450 [Rickenella mellea]
MFHITLPPFLIAFLIAAAFIGYAASGLILLIVRQQRSPLRRLRGPPNPSFFLGNLVAMHDQENTNLVARWEEEYGPTFVYHGFISGCRLMTTDPRAVAHILGNAYDYPKPDFVRDSLSDMVAGQHGILTTEGEQHKRQRKILTPAFSVASVKAVSPIFWDKAAELRDIWLRIADDPDLVEYVDARGVADWGKGWEPKPPKVDALAWLGRATLDVIGLAGFGYPFNSLTDDTNELALAFATIFSSARKFRAMIVLQVWFPILRRLRPEKGTMRQTQETIRRIGLSLIEERKELVIAEAAGSKSPTMNGHANGNAEKSVLGRDLLSVLIRSNMTSVENQRMNTEEILCQISTFIAAGHETTSNALSWTLYALATNLDVQTTLRHHIRGLDALPPGVSLDDAIGRLPYLDWVVREALRVHAPISATMRVCARARDAIPVSRPFVDRDGVTRTAIDVTRHDIISIPLQAVNKSDRLWGDDAQEFRPERWANPPDEINGVPGLWSHILTFLNGNPLNGNRACIGYKFALAEIKIFLYVLLRDIEYTIDSDLVIEKKVNVVTRPCVKSEPEVGNQMPLRMRRVHPEEP